MMIELEHSPLGGSATHRFMTCAGSFLLQRELIQNGEFEQIESSFAKLGTAAHALGAKCLEEGTEPFEYIGQVFEGYRAGWPNEIGLDAVAIYVNECRDIVAKNGRDGAVTIEQTFTKASLHPLLKGTVDFGYWHRSHGLWLRDYKNGEGVGVSPIDNKQLAYYAFLQIECEPGLSAMPRDFPVNLGISQPNFYGLHETVLPWETTLGDIQDWGYDELLPVMHKLTQSQDIDDDDFVTGEHCQFCSVMLECPKMQAAFQEYAEASEDFTAMLTNAELDKLYSQRENARRFMNALEATVKARAISGTAFTSAKLVEMKTNRVFKPGAEDALAKELGNAVYDPPKLKSPAGTEKLSSRAKELVLEWAYKPESDRLTIAPISDPRPEAKPRTNENVFAAHAQTLEQAGW